MPLGGKVTPPASGFEGGVVKVPLGGIIFVDKEKYKDKLWNRMFLNFMFRTYLMGGVGS